MAHKEAEGPNVTERRAAFEIEVEVLKALQFAQAPAKVADLAEGLAVPKLELEVLEVQQVA